MDVRTLANLARLQLSDADAERFSTQLDDVLRYVEQIRAVDTTGVVETSHPLELAPAFREDVPTPSLDREAALANAPSADAAAGLFRVPKVIG